MSYSVIAYCRDCRDEYEEGCFGGLSDTIQEAIPTLEEAIEIGSLCQNVFAENGEAHHWEFEIRESWDHGVVVFDSHYDKDLIKNGINCDEILRRRAHRLDHWTEEVKK